MSENIYVTKSFLPKKSEYFSYIEKIFDNNLPLTNNSELVVTLERNIKNFLNIPYFHYVTNGTIAIQLALEAYQLEHCEVITTPFSYVATVNSILWQKCTPIFVDIEPNNFTIDPSKIEEKITPKTKAIVAVHVFGYACDVEKLQHIAKKYNLKLIYDGAHAFGSSYHGKSLLSYGDISTCSFHATKLFHTIEGGAIITPHEDINDIINLSKRFGHIKDTYSCVGINAKQSEFHAAMGLCNLPYLPEIISKRKKISDYYRTHLKNICQFPKKQEELTHNYAYFPVLFENEKALLTVFEKLAQKNIFPRRYFYPSLNALPFLPYTPCSISEDIASRIACLPLYPQLSEQEIEKICQIIIQTL